MVFFSTPERTRYLEGSLLYTIASPTQRMCSQSKHLNTLLKLWTDSATNRKKRRNICSPCCPPLSGLISPAWSFSALSHSSSLKAASVCNRLITSPIALQICHIDKASHADSQRWKSLSDAACCPGD